MVSKLAIGSLALFFVVLSLTAPVQASSHDDWSQIRNDSQNTRHNPNIDAPKQKVGVEWTYETGIKYPLGGYVVDDSTIYFHRGSSLFSNPDSSLYAVNTSTHDKEWVKKGLSSGYSGGLAMHGDTLFSVGENSSLHAINKSTGTTEWKYDTNLSLPDLNFRDGVVYYSGEGKNPCG